MNATRKRSHAERRRRARGPLLRGLTNGADHTEGLSVLFDAKAELDAVAGLVEAADHVHPSELASLLDGITRRLGAAHELLLVEHWRRARAGGGSR